ncbi:hypothetical protein N7508_001379 [Penicillium antarcticum]|uniref:uncharacterized protein n=1 Tax=Penicillium antarcticum TaxID=416450 RepID=UPI0023990869|nr:uncharacterized protein N7508_001379 [Penicillium antarcticum]KAJ5316871.1 hypothetical protein N7508_001379 [Penicillium antarcticum]
MSAEDACQLLDIFFADHRNSVSNITCPYILTTVLRKKSVLHPNHPRKTSLALLTTILWTVAQTAESGIYYLPGSRKRIVDHLYSLTLTHFHLRDIDNWHRVPGGWQLDEDDMFNVDQQQCNKARTTYSKGPNPTVDDVLTLTLRTLVISGGEFKADCIKWWNKTVSLVRLLGYNTEAGLNTTHDPSADTFETQEERRRAFWLVYILDRHLALSYNRPLCILDAECRVLTPLPEELWQSLDTTSIPHRSFGPPTTISGSGIFEYFLPLTALLGDIIELRLIHHHPRLTMCSELATFEVKHSLEECEESLKSFADSQVSTVHTFQATTSQVRASLVVAYSSYILKVLYVLLYGKWDAVTMLEDTGEWISTNNFSECASNSIAASQSLTEILRVDPELSFMPYLFGIYLFHGSFILLLFAERMPQIGPNESVEQACEVIIRAHEVSIVTLSTEFQKTFRKAFRSVLYGVRNFEVTEPDFPVIRKEVLAMYRWTMGHKGLCL